MQPSLCVSAFLVCPALLVFSFFWLAWFSFLASGKRVLRARRDTYIFVLLSSFSVLGSLELTEF